jgi:hypothetical protein
VRGGEREGWVRERGRETYVKREGGGEREGNEKGREGGRESRGWREKEMRKGERLKGGVEIELREGGGAREGK